MIRRNLGQSTLFVSKVGLGCNNFGWRIDQERATEVVQAALDADITLFDTADVYGRGASEEMLARALGSSRSAVVIATKFGHASMSMEYDEDLGPKGGRRYIRHAVEQSLRRLGTDYIDLYQMHTPDPSTPIQETLTVLHELVVEGKVRYLGQSNFPAALVEEAGLAAKDLSLTPFISAQEHWSLLERGIEDEVLPAVRTYGLGVLPYFPLAHGLLTGKVRGGIAPTGSRLADRPTPIPDEQLAVVDDLNTFAQSIGRTILDVAIGVLAATRPVSSVIAGATSAEQVRSNAAAGSWSPTAEEQEIVWSLTERLRH